VDRDVLRTLIELVLKGHIVVLIGSLRVVG
jgi:hypothetical protein